MHDASSAARPQTWLLVGAFAAVYLIWGSTYYAIAVAVETMPPLLMAGVRALLAGFLLLAVLGVRGAPRLKAREAAVAGGVGVLLMLGNGAVTWSTDQGTPSGLAAVLVAMVPIWIAVLGWRLGGARPTKAVVAGLAMGLGGVALLLGPGLGATSVPLVGGLVILAGTVSWASGSLASRGARLPPALSAIAIEMLVGGAALSLIGLGLGEGSRVHLDAVSFRSAAAFAYLVLFGSLVAFTAYVWLLRVQPPGRVATYAFVNPVVAVLLGWALAAEPLTPRTLLAAAVIVAGVALTTLGARPALAHDARALLHGRVRLSRRRLLPRP